MQISSIPVKMPVYWAQNAGAAYVRTVPQNSQIGITNGAASFNDGWVPLNMTPEGAGGIPPFGQDANGIMRVLTQWEQWYQSGGPIQLDTTFQGNIAGYPQYAIVQSVAFPGTQWMSLVDNNTSNPDSGGDNWITVGDGARNDVKWRPTSETLPGWIVLNGTTIGSASSSASQLAAAKALNAYTWLWNNFPQTICAVTGGRGASAAADFAANKTIATLDMRGAGAIGMDTMASSTTTNLSGVPIILGGNAAATGASCSITANTLANIEAGLAPATLTVTGAVTGTWAVGMTVGGTSPGFPSGIVITSLGTGSGGTGSYVLNKPVTIPTQAMTGYNASSPGALIGENSHVSTVQEIASHTHVSGTSGGLGVASGGNSAAPSGVSGATGGGAPHNNVPLAYTGYWYLHL